ncbi:MAG: acyl-CoA dehydrogenase family protein [Acidimicrobiales bacterium]
MTTTTTITAPTQDNGGERRPGPGDRHPAPLRHDDDRFVELAAEVGAVAAAHATNHDRDASFVTEAYAAMRANGYLRLAVPTELGGLGASIRQVCYAQAELARHDGATALAAAMHLYGTLVQVYRRNHGAPDAEGVLRRIAAEDLIVATSGGSDWLWPSTVAVVDDEGGGFRVTGRKSFCSQAPEASVISTSAVLCAQGEVPAPGSEVLHFSVPLAADGVRIEETWDSMGMRGTASHDLVFEEVLVPSERIVARRPWGEFGPALQVAALHFAPVGGATYFGIAAGARDYAVAQATGGSRGVTPSADLVRIQRQVGLMDARLRVAWWALMGSIDQLGDDFEADGETMAMVMLAKREAAIAAGEVVALAMEVVGGRAYLRRCPLERAFRDVRAAVFHPLNPEITLTYAGRLALGGSGAVE